MAEHLTETPVGSEHRRPPLRSTEAKNEHDHEFVRFNEEELPEVKTWNVGEHYHLLVEVQQVETEMRANIRKEEEVHDERHRQPPNAAPISISLENALNPASPSSVGFSSVFLVSTTGASCSGSIFIMI